MVYIGNHLSISKGYEEMGKEALELNANTFAFFTRNPRGGKLKTVDKTDIEKLLKIIQENKFGTLVAHAPYTMNLCSSTEKVRKSAEQMLKEDIMRMEMLPNNYYNFHPGSHTGLGIDIAIPMIAEALNNVLNKDMKTTILLETMAGKGSEIGSTFEELKRIIDLVELKDKIGVCFDTCHVWDAGYDIVNNLDGVLEKFDKIIGLNKLKAIHLNDSLNICGSHKDRHARLGEGQIGLEALKRIVQHPFLQGIPFILETPNNDNTGYANEIALVREWIIK